MRSSVLFSALGASLLLSAAQAKDATSAPLAQQAPASASRVSTSLPSAPTAAAAVVTSSVSLPFQVAEAQLERAEGRSLVIAQRLVRGAQVVPGSSRLGTQVLPEPRQGAETVYWTVPAQASGVLTFALKGAAAEQLPPAALAWVDSRGALSALGSGKVDVADYVTARVPRTGENKGAIRSPLAGSEYRSTDQISAVVESRLDAPLRLSVNGQPVPEDRIGTKVEDPNTGVLRLEYYGVRLQPGRNVLRAGNDEVEVFVATGIRRIELEPLQLVADGSTPVRVRVRAFDAAGVGAATQTVTVVSNLEPLARDAEPGVTGYQLRLRDGEGVLELKPQVTPQVLNLEFISGEQNWTERLNVIPDRREVGVGVASATVGLNSEPLSGAVWQARASYEGPIGDGKLYVSADKDGLPQTPGVRENNERFPHYGDQSTETVPLRSSGPVAALYEHPAFRVAYRYDALPSDILPLGQSVTAVAAQTKGLAEVGVYAAAVPGSTVMNEELVPDGTRLLRLKATDIVPGSLGLVLVATDPVTGQETERRTLDEGREWIVDPVSGVVTLVRPLGPLDETLARQKVLAIYSVAESAAPTSYVYGAQVVRRGETQALGRTGRYLVGAGAASVEDQWTFGVRGTYQDAALSAEGRVLVAGGVLSEFSVRDVTAPTARAGVRVGNGNGLSLRYQSEGYDGLGAGTAGFRADGRYQKTFGEKFGVALNGVYGSDQSQNYAEALALYRSAPWTVGAGARYTFGERSGLGATGSVGYQNRRLSAELKHSQPVSGTAKPETELGVSYRFTENVSLVARDRYVWGEGHLAAVGLTNRVGKTTYEVGYDTGAAGGQAGQARLGAGTSWDLNDRVSVGLRGTYVRDLGKDDNRFSVSSDIRYRGDGYSASAGVDARYSSSQGASTVVRGAVSGSLTPALSLSADGTADLGQTQGLKFGVGYAYRAVRLSSLGYARYASGSLAGLTPQVTAGMAAEYVGDPLRVRAGVDLRMLLAQPESLTYQPYVGGQFRVTERFGVGGWARAFIQPGSNTALFGYGVEGGVAVLKNTWITLGYNPQGFEGLSTAGLYTRQGAYMRLDLTLDEQIKR